MLSLSTTLLFLSLSFSLADAAGDVSLNGACTVGNNRLQVGTYEFSSDCNTFTYCNSKSNTCEKKECRNDEFPFGYNPGADLPPRCGDGQFCPDEEDRCQDILPVDSDCQLNRDDQCQPPPDAKDLTDKSPHGLNVKGAVCLNFKCMWANVTLGLPCVVENTAYISYGVDDEYIDIVSRDNCRIGLYCDTAQKVCIQRKDLMVECTADKECLSYNCGANGRCLKDASGPNDLPVWVYVVVGIGIFGGMIGTLYGLFYFHGKQREVEREKRMQYWREQTAFRQNILQMRETARNSILSQGSLSARSSMLYHHRDREGFSDDSHAPILQFTSKSSNLRQPISDDRDHINSIVLLPQPQTPYKGGRL